jgi:hypothetical protein
MEVKIKLLAATYLIVLFSAFFFMIKNKSVKPFYLLLWLLVCLFMLSFVVFEKQYQWIAGVLSVQNATLLVIVALISFLLLFVLYISIKISELSNKVQELISYTSILENEIRKLKKAEENDKVS